MSPPPVSVSFAEESDEESIKLDLGGGDSLAGSCGTHKQDQDEDGYSSMYFQREGLEYMTPILFEDGMDFVECSFYYLCRKSQDSGGVLYRERRRCQPRATTEQLTHMDNAQPSPCIRRPFRFHSFPSLVTDIQARRCSFSGIPDLGNNNSDSQLIRSNSMRSLRDQVARVSFEEYVQVVTIRAAHDYPEDVRSGLWISREEMAKVAELAVPKRDSTCWRMGHEVAPGSGLVEILLVSNVVVNTVTKAEGNDGTAGVTPEIGRRVG
ncbi:predicted protein [Phaeodactylum tricornutum CCAP 1055/1]|uniref:Uncharacterized protein n=2 Tax=Phaeodactylum tricornutum TaxID=2850 RepID=B7FQM7_PHATC|nr:predicted protein [Phaeodactylum tricornutum CCAP 1055/1]EEC51895.1 predicted protein [Phaeodactylum tricornutum CCAP 1055/1]|eukprot:XP_002177432.1 predicted protein [Phaeodactylum tricornutum CCAP 1055/1]